MALFRISRALGGARSQRSIYGNIGERTFKLDLGSSIVSQPPDLITGDFLVRENNFIIATENDKLIELDIS